MTKIISHPYCEVRNVAAGMSMTERTQKAFGLSAIDKLLGGGLSKGCSVLMVSDHPASRKTAFMGYFALEELIGDGKVFAIEYLYPSHLFYNLPDFLTSPSFFQEIEKKKRYFILNCYGKVDYPLEFKLRDSVIEMSNPTDLAKLRYEIEKLRSENVPEGMNARWIFDDITSMIITVGDDNKALKFLRDFFHFLRKNGDLGLFFIERRAHSVQLMTALEDLAGAIITLNVKEIGETFIPYLRVVKNRGFGADIITTEVPYLLTAKGISLKTNILEDFDTIKKFMTITQEGVMELFGSEFLILPKDMYMSVIENYYKRVNYDEYNKVLYESGKLAGKKLYPFFSNLIRTRAQFGPSDLINVLNSFGIGKTEIIKIDLRKGLLHIRMYNLGKWEADKPVHAVVSGLITSCIELFTRSQWDCSEIKCCVNSSDNYCEFIATPAEEVGFLIHDLQSLKDALIMDKNGGLTLKGSRAIVLSNENLLSIINSIESLTSKKVSREIQYNMGKSIATQFCTFISKKYNMEGEAVFNFWVKISGARGWGYFHLEYYDKEKKTAHLVIDNTIIGSVSSVTGECVDDLTSGIIAGLFQYITSDNTLVCKEVKCLAKGDAKCEFIVKPEKDFI